MKVLLVEDEKKVASFIKKGLEVQNYEVEIAYDGEIGKRLFFNNYYDIVILDINLPQINGYELCRIIRGHNSLVPVIMLTAFDSIDDKVTGFEAGADDYLAKPFEFKELILRIRALARRVHDRNRSENAHVLSIADLELNMDEKSVRRAGQKIDLTAREFSLLEYLLRNRGKVISRVDIAEKVWELNFDTGTNVIDVYINFLRKKIDKEFTPKLIHTVIGMGYVLKEE